MTIAVDFDGTIVEHRYPRIGKEIPFATDTLKLLQQGFTKAFWVSNTVELFERMAYYAVFIVLTIYLSSANFFHICLL